MCDMNMLFWKKIIQPGSIPRIFGLFLLAATLLFSSGCSIVHIGVALGPEGQKLRAGEHQFELGNYSAADELFSEVFTSDAGNLSKNNALYNLVCTRIITAKTTADLIAAIELLDNWQKLYPSGIYVENPNMMIMALQKQSKLIGRDITKTKEQVGESKAIISRQKKEIEELQQKLETLQHQITELQAIDQQLQEKKKPL